MTSVDSGVETGNDSNDSSIVQHKSLTPSQSGESNNVVATTACIQAEDAMNAISFRRRLSVNTLLSLSSLELTECSDYSGDHRTSTSGNTMSEVQEFRYPPMYESNTLSKNKEIGKKIVPLSDISDRKMRTVRYAYRARQSFTCPEVNFQGPFGERKMRHAATTNDTIMMSRLLSSGVSPNNYDQQERTPLHLASGRGYTDMVRLLLEHGANPNMRDHIGFTPLHLATLTFKIPVVTLLLKAGIDIPPVDKDAYNPLQLAQQKLWRLDNYIGNETQRVKQEVHNVVSMLLAYFERQKDTSKSMELLSILCTRLTISCTSDQIHNDIKNLLVNVGTELSRVVSETK